MDDHSNNSCGRGHHKRRKKNARARFDRRKNDERHRQQANKENTHPPISTDVFPDSSLLLPRHWQKLSETQYCKVEEGSSGLGEVTASVIIDSDRTWNAYVGDKKVPDTCIVLAKFRSSPLTEDKLTDVIKAIDSAGLCPGNPDEKFVLVCKDKGGAVRGARGNGRIIASIDSSNVVDHSGKAYQCTVRREDCDVLCEKSSLYPLRCQSCQAFRSTLRSMVSRRSNESDNHMSVSSHTRYCDLTSGEKDERMKNLHRALKVSNQKVKRLQTKVDKMIANEAVHLQSDDSADISHIVTELSPIVEDTYALNSPQRIFWDQQKRYNSLRNKRQMRWHPLVIRFALNLKYLSSTAYRAVRQSGMIDLPSERTLSDYTHWTTPHTGVQLEFIERFQSLLEEEVPCGQHQCALSMDEMKLKSGLVFNKNTGTLSGFVDLGSSNRDMEQALGGGGDLEESSSGQLAEQVFVFLARAVFKPSLSIPIAHYFSSSLKGENIFPLAWEVIKSLEMYDIPVVSLTSDGAKANRRFYAMCQQQQQKGKSKDVPYKTFNPFREGKDLFFFCDAPHLLKTARNCFSNSFAHSNSRKMQKNGQKISWKWIESLYLRESTTTTLGVRMCHKLTKDHVWLTSFTRMRVYLAAQVMSESVASALEFLDNDATQQTRLFIRMIDKFFDCLNAKGPQMAKLKRKDDIAPYARANDERFKWLLNGFLGYLIEWEREIALLPGLKQGERQKMTLSKETIDGLKITVKSFTELGPQLLRLPGVKYLLSEVFSQDPLERYFSRQRHRGGSNENPTANQVPYNASTLVQQQSMYHDLKTMNVEAEMQGNQLRTVSQPLPKRPRKT